MSGDTTYYFVVRYRASSIEGGRVWVDYSRHPATKLGLHNALLSEHDRVDILMARGEAFEVGVFVMRDGVAEVLSDEGAERLFRSLPSGDVKWIDLCACMLPEVDSPSSPPAEANGQLGLFPHIHTAYDDAAEPSEVHVLDTRA